MKTKTTLTLTMMMLACLQLFGQQKIYIATTGQQLYSVNLTNCSFQLLGPSGVELYDIAVTPNGQLWGIADPGYLYKVDTLTGAATFMGILGFPGNALVELDDSTLLMAGAMNLYRINVITGSVTFIGVVGGLSTVSSGDLTWYDNDLYLITTGRLLVKIQLNSTNTAVVSSTPVTNNPNPFNVWGAMTAPFASETNSIIGFPSRAAYKICPFDESYQKLCDSIIPITAGVIGGAASVRLPTQNPLPDSCGLFTPTTVSEFSLSESFQLNPNPATTKIEIRNLNPDSYGVAIYDLTGKKVFQSQTSDRTSQTDVDVSQLSAGVYVLQIQTANSIVTKKFVVAR